MLARYSRASSLSIAKDAKASRASEKGRREERVRKHSGEDSEVFWGVALWANGLAAEAHADVMTGAGANSRDSWAVNSGWQLTTLLFPLHAAFPSLSRLSSPDKFFLTTFSHAMVMVRMKQGPIP